MSTTVTQGWLVDMNTGEEVATITWGDDRVAEVALKTQPTSTLYVAVGRFLDEHDLVAPGQ